MDLLTGHKRMAFTGKTLGEAVERLLAGFGGITLTPNTRQVVGSQVVEECVISGSHTGSFAGAEPTQGKVHVNVKLTATAGPDSMLQSLRVDADSRALFAQIADSGDIIGVGGRLIAGARERHNGVRVIDAPRPTAGHGPPASDAGIPTSAKESSSRWPGLASGSNPSGGPAKGDGAPPNAKGSRRKWVALTTVPVLLLIVFLTWRQGSSQPSLAADHPATSTSTPSATSTTPATTPTPTPTPTASTALPVIATEAPKSVPHVQAGKQLVLRSDVLFALDSAALTPAAKTAVTTLANQIRSSHVTGTIQINGYTDNLGSNAYDLALSKARALAVAQVLQAGLSPGNRSRLHLRDSARPALSRPTPQTPTARATGGSPSSCPLRAEPPTASVEVAVPSSIATTPLRLRGGRLGAVMVSRQETDHDREDHLQALQGADHRRRRKRPHGPGGGACTRPRPLTRRPHPEPRTDPRPPSQMRRPVRTMT